uniref:Uncharacterized protein n=1 Tax=Rhizophora mucronata TaxID=61149 RepID=A0A2P2P3L7_RHIMU
MTLSLAGIVALVVVAAVLVGGFLGFREQEKLGNTEV